MDRVIAYIDGFNLYFGLRSKGWKYFYWLNVQAVITHLLKQSQTLVTTKYFTSIVTYPPDKQRRQATFLEALSTLSDFQIYYGHYLAEKVTCHNCGYTYTTHHEKMTDVNIAVELMTDAFQNAFDLAFLVSADSDLAGPLRSLKQLFPQKRVLVIFPPGRQSITLKNIASAYTFLGPNILSRSLFPDEVVKPNGFVLQRPKEWY